MPRKFHRGPLFLPIFLFRVPASGLFTPQMRPDDYLLRLYRPLLRAHRQHFYPHRCQIHPYRRPLHPKV